MPKGPFLPNEFVPTQCSTSAEKANFGNTLLHFLDANCAQELFTKKFYNRLSMTFGHIGSLRDRRLLLNMVYGGSTQAWIRPEIAPLALPRRPEVHVQ